MTVAIHPEPPPEIVAIVKTWVFSIGPPGLHGKPGDAITVHPPGWLPPWENWYQMTVLDLLSMPCPRCGERNRMGERVSPYTVQWLSLCPGCGAILWAAEEPR